MNNVGWLGRAQAAQGRISFASYFDVYKGIALRIEDAFQPALLVSEIYALLLEEYRGNTDELMVDTIERASEDGFFRGAALLPVVAAGQRSRLARILERTGLSLTVWFNPLIAAEGLNLSSLDEGLRKRSVQRLKECFDQAIETGAEFLGLCSGPDPKPGSPEIRAEATARFQESLLELCQTAQDHSRTVVLEPLDRGAHKNGLIGPVSEAAALVERVRSSFSNVALCWDSAHTALCGEDPLESLEIAAGTIAQIHLSNAVLDRRKPGFGDHHMPPGPPGFLDVDTAARIFERALKVGLFGSEGSRPASSRTAERTGTLPYVTVEARTPPGRDPWEMIANCARFMTDAWENQGAR